MHYFSAVAIFFVLYLHTPTYGYLLTVRHQMPYIPRWFLTSMKDVPKRNTESDPGSAEGELDGKNHPCYRKCDGSPKTCYYHFHVEWYQAMSKACYDCPFNATDCGRKDCVMADGQMRPIAVVNRKMPGPSIEVCQNDKIIVNVTNDLMAAGTTVHWHGYHLKDNPFMDGVPYVTQCPIQPESDFVYKFDAVQAGTYLWHSHIGMQRGDGMAGALIVRCSGPNRVHLNSRLPRRRGLRPRRSTFHYLDKSEHVILVTDWSKRPSLDMFTDHFHSSGGTTPSELLINGRGRFQVTNGNNTVISEAPRFDVAKGKNYRFRFINAQFYACPVELSVDDHDLIIVASDGYDLEPVTAKSLVSYAGERFDFIIRANKKVDNYWIKIRGILHCENMTEVRQVAVLHYENAKETEPVRKLKWKPRNNRTEINTVNKGEEQEDSTTISMLRSSSEPNSVPGNDALKPVPDHKFYIAYDLHKKNNPHYNKAPFYGHEQVNRTYSVFVPQLNHISMKVPKSPLLVSRPSSDVFCNENTVKKSCKTEYCQCPHVISVKRNSVVEVVIIDEGSSMNTNHPFHLHGHSFRVIGQRRLGEKTTVDYVKEFDRRGLMSRNLKNAPVKDTVTVPDGGYTIIRFKADNPGYWLFHCHIEFHADVGMALVFKVGEHEEMKPVPVDFPRCGDFNNNDKPKEIHYNMVQKL